MEILKGLFDEVNIPMAVRDEVVKKDDAASDALKKADWIKVCKIDDELAKESFKSKLHDGEVEAILLARERNDGEKPETL